MSSPEPSPGESSGAEAGDGEQAASVFASLPRTRPAVRSPRRAEPIQPEDGGAEAESVDAGPAGSGGREQELEALARASLSLAGGVATLGLRAAGRAAAAVRDAVERS